MLKTIIYREFLANIVTARFSLGLIICVVLVGANTYVLTRSYEDRLQSYQQAVQAHTDEIRNIRVYSELGMTHRPKADRKPRLMGIFNEGVEGRLGNKVDLAHGLVPVRAEQHGADNPYLVVFRRIDLTLVFQIVISLLALLFAYDTIAGERENGTLPLTLSNPVPRGVLLLGKYLGGMLSLILPLTISLLIGLLVVLLSPYTAIDGAAWARICLFFFISLIYVSVFFTLGMFFSSRTRRTATALMLAMFFWVVFVLVWPNASAFAVSKLVPVKSDADLTWEGFITVLGKNGYDDAVARHRLFSMWINQYQRETEDFVKKHDVEKSFNGSSSNSTTVGRTQIGKYGGPPEKLQLYHEYLKFSEELRITYADKQGQMWQEYLSLNPIRQAKLALNIARISPAASYTNATAILAETDLESHLHFLQQARQYRHELIQFLRNEKAFGSETWYNPDAEKKVLTEAIPLFSEQEEPISSSIERMRLDLLILIMLNVIFFLLTYLSFMRYDVK